MKDYSKIVPLLSCVLISAIICKKKQKKKIHLCAKKIFFLTYFINFEILYKLTGDYLYWLSKDYTLIDWKVN